MVYRDFENTQPVSRSFHLHLQIPAVGLLAHVELFERITTNGAKWRHIRVTNPVQDSQNQSSQSAGKDLLEIHSAVFALSARARPDHKIVRSARYGINKLVHKCENVAAVAIQKHHDVTFGDRKSVV